MTYRIIIPKLVQKQLDDLPKKQRERLISVIRLLADEPRPSGVKKLKGYDKTYRIRVGDYRVIYNIEDQEKLILIRAIARLIYSKKSLTRENHITKYLTLKYKHIQFFTQLSNRRRSPKINRGLVAIGILTTPFT
jgi:mRNA interferase RelE/StbE